MNAEMMKVDEGNSLVLSLTHATQCYSSLVPKTVEEKKAFFNLVNNPQKRLAEMINMEIHLKDIYAETCEFVDQETGVATPGVRIVFVDDKGVSYQAASKGIFTSTQKLLAIMGQPSEWDKPVTIIPKEIVKGANRRVLVFQLK